MSDLSKPIQFLPVSHGELGSLAADYLASLVAPLDGMWEALGKLAQSFEIRLETHRIGFCVVNADGLILQFHLSPEGEPHAPSAFAALRERAEIRRAVVSTADPRFLSLCLDAQLQMSVHTILYTEHRFRPQVSDGLEDTSITAVQAGELAEIAELQRHSLDQDPGDWLTGYLQNLIAREELFALRRSGEILATGEIRVSDSQPPFADLGVIVLRRFRRRGVAGDVLSRLADRCVERGLQPICSTTVDNVASRRAIGNAGFLPRHRLLEIALR